MEPSSEGSPIRLLNARCLCLLFLSAWGLGGAACASDGRGDAPAPRANLFADPGFEEGAGAWAIEVRGTDQRVTFAVSDEVAFEGAHSALLELDSGMLARPGPTRASSIVQFVEARPFPESVEGRFRVDRWERAGDEMGLQVKVSVVVWRDPRTPEILASFTPNAAPPARPIENYAIQYQLAGRGPLLPGAPAAGPPALVNSQERIVAAGPPPQEEWIDFSLPIRADFERMWGVVPADYEYVSFLFQAVWMRRPQGSTVAARVYFDDLVLRPGPG